MMMPINHWFHVFTMPYLIATFPACVAAVVAFRPLVDALSASDERPKKPCHLRVIDGGDHDRP